MHPSNEVLETLGIQVVLPLAGRINQHWLVLGRGQQLVLRLWAKPWSDIEYELRVLESIAALGWPVACAVERPVAVGGQVWCLFPFLPGTPYSLEDRVAEQRKRGRLLAEFHAGLAQLGKLGQRDGWRRCEAILEDPNLDSILAEHEQERPEDVRIFRWHLDRARARIAAIQPHARPGTIVHGDFTPWNLRYREGHLSGILDFELAHWDHRVGDFALSWRRRYDAIIHAYTEVSPLETEEWELLTPVWWARLIDCGCQDMAAGTHDDGWVIRSLLRRSRLMGPDAVEFK